MWQTIAMVNNLQIAVKQTARRELEKQQAGTPAEAEESSAPVTSQLQRSKFRSAKTRNSYAGNEVETNWTQGQGQQPTMTRSQISVIRVMPTDELEFTLS